MKYHWRMDCNKCGKLLGYYCVTSEYEPDGWVNHEFLCRKCNKEELEKL